MKFHVVLQRGAMECGAACLTMICRLYGYKTDLAYVSDDCQTGKNGVSLLAVSRVAKSYGLDNKTVKLTVDKLAELNSPCILHWRQNHFVVLVRVERRGRRFIVADPGRGLLHLDRHDFEQNWLGTTSSTKGIAMFFEPTADFEVLKQAKRTPKHSRSRIFSYLRGYHRQMVQIFAGLVLGCLLQLVLPFLTQGIVDLGIKHQDVSLIWLILLGELMIVAGRTVTDFVRRWLLLHISMRVNISMVSDFLAKLLRLPMRYFETRNTGDLLQRMSDHQRIQSFMVNEMLGIALAATSFMVFGIVLLIYDLKVFAIFVAGSAVYCIWGYLFMARRKVIDYELFDVEARNQNNTFRLLSSAQEVKLQRCEKRRRQLWEDTQAAMFAVRMRSLKLQQTQEAGSVFINEIKNILITVLAATAVINGNITLGAMLAIQYVVGQMNAPVSQIMQFIYSVQDMRISLDRVNEVNARDDENQPGRVCKLDPTNKSIVIRGLKFAYDKFCGIDTLTNIDLTIPQGKLTAIVGPSGSGKTTLIKLILGFYPIDSGEILIGNRPLNHYDIDWLRSRCGVVMQNGVIFTESIARNIAVADGPVDAERLRQAARIANIDKMVDRLPLGFDTTIGPDGLALSQGERQRILIARAVYKNPDILILDEATNSLDAVNERAIVNNLAQFYANRTVIVIAHRLSTVCDAHNIVVLDGGRVVETGDHQTLTAMHGKYYTLIKNQLEMGT